MTLTVKHSTLTGAPSDPDALVDGPAWDADHDVTGNLPVTQLDDGSGASEFTYWRGDGSWSRVGVFNPWGVVHRKLRDGNSIVINWFGDSLTFGYTPPSGQSSFNPPLALFQACQWLKYGGVSAVNNKGFTGDTAAQGYGRWSSTTGGDVWIIMYGQNDANNGITVASFYSQMVQWVELALTRGAAPLLLSTPHNQTSANDFNSRPYAEAMKEIATRYNVPHVDVEEQVGWLANRWNADGVHYNDGGYNEIGYHLAALIAGYDGVNIRRITPGTTLYCTDNFAAGTTLFAWAPGVVGQLAEINVSNDYLMVSGYFPEDVYPIITMGNSNVGTTRQINVLYGGGNFVSVSNFSNPGGDGTNVPYRTHHQAMRLPKGYRTMLIVNPDATNKARIESIQFIAANDVIHQAPGDSNYTIPNGYTDVALGVVLTGARVWTLPAASSVRANTPIIVRDAIGGLTGSNTITLTRAGADTINGATTFVMSQAWMRVTLVSDGVSSWQASYQILLGAAALYNTVPVANGGTGATTAASARTNLGVTATGADTAYNARANNLSDVASPATARTNLGLVAVASSGSAADLSTGTLPSGRLSGNYSALTERQFMGGGSGGTGVAAGATIYLGPGYQQFAFAAIAGIVMPFSGTAKNLYVISNAAPVGAQTYTFTLNKNGSDQAVTCQMTGAATTANDTTHSFTFAAGDYICLKAVTSATAAAGSVFMFGFEADNP